MELLGRLEGSLSELEKMIHKIPKHIETLEKQIKICDDETQDILHLMELSSFNAQEGWKLSKDLQMTRQARRNAKNELEGLRKIQERFNNRSQMNIHVESANRDLNNYTVKLSKRKYAPRVRLDFEEKFNQISAKKKDVTVR